MKHLDTIGLLSPRLTLAHCVWARPDELELLAERGVTIVVSNSSNLHLRSGVAPVPAMLEKGCRVALGVDGKALDEDDDGLRELRLAHLLHAGTGFKVAASREQMLKIAFANGRFAVTNVDDGGAIAPGAPADLLLLDWAAIDDDGLRDDLDPIELLLGRATLQHVRELIVAGRTIVKDGKILGADLPAARARSAGRDARRHESRRAARRRDARARSRDGAAFRTARALLLKALHMPIARVHRISAAAPDDVSGIEAAVKAGAIDPRAVIAVLGKTEGNGCVNDFTRGYATLSLSQFFARHIPKEQADQICFVMSGGTEGGMAPHWTIFERIEGNSGRVACARGRPRTYSGRCRRSNSGGRDRSMPWPRASPPR